MLSSFRPSLLMVIGLILGMGIAFMCAGCQGTISMGVSPGWKPDGHRLTSQVETVREDLKNQDKKWWHGADLGLRNN